MLQRCRERDLLEEALGPELRGELGAQQLERDPPAMLQILGQIHRRHAARTQLTLDAIAIGERGAEGLVDHWEGVRGAERERAYGRR